MKHDKGRRGTVEIAVVGVIINDKNQVLLSLRKDEEIKEADFCWELPGGKVEFGETATECLIREIQEETGYLVNPIEIVDCIWTNIWEKQDKSKIQVLLLPFLCVPNGGAYLKNDQEILESRWFSEKELSSLNLKALPGNLEIVRSAYAQIKERKKYERRKKSL